jgi:hypothetical protein
VKDEAGQNVLQITLSLVVESLLGPNRTHMAESDATPISLWPWMAETERARSLGDGPVVTRRSHVTDGVPDNPVKRLKL